MKTNVGIESFRIGAFLEYDKQPTHLSKWRTLKGQEFHNFCENFLID